MKNGSFLIKIALAFSGTAVTILNCTSIKWIIANGFISFVIWCFLLFRTNLFNKVFPGHFSKQRIFLSLISSSGIAFSWSINGLLANVLQKYGERVIEELSQYMTIPIEYNTTLMFLLRIGIFGLAFISIPALFAFLYWFHGILYQTAQAFIRDIKKYETVYLVIISAVVTISIISVFNITSAFGEPMNRNNIIFTSDSGTLIRQNEFLNISAGQNNIRQPLFALFAMPFSIYPFLISKALFFIPNAYPIAIQIIQVFLLQITVIMLSRMIGLRGISAVAFCIIISLSYPYLLFTFMIEQYIFGVFYMILFLYIYLNKDTIYIKNGREVFFIAATGSLLTSSILFPCTVSTKGKDTIKKLVNLGIIFLLAVILCGQANIIWNAFSSITSMLMRFAGGSVSVIDRLLQYFNFIALCIVKPDVIFVYKEFISYQLAPVTSLNYSGILFFMLTVISFAINRKNKLAQICMAWVVYSSVILFAIGWGTAENGLVLYSLYFAWSFLTLLFMGIEKFFRKLPSLKYTIYAVLIIYLALVNIPAIYDIIHFGITYYPARSVR